MGVERIEISSGGVLWKYRRGQKFWEISEL